MYFTTSETPMDDPSLLNFSGSRYTLSDSIPCLVSLSVEDDFSASAGISNAASSYEEAGRTA